jgi:CRP-like cAMP-binding protein
MISPERIRRYPHFAPIDEQCLKEVAMLAEERTYETGESLFNDNEPADYLLLILDGEVSLNYTLGTGEQRTIDTLVTGDLAVWSALVEPYKTTGEGVATKPTSVVAIEAAPLRRLCEQETELGYRLMTQIARVVSQRLEGARVQLAVV